MEWHRWSAAPSFSGVQISMSLFYYFKILDVEGNYEAKVHPKETQKSLKPAEQRQKSAETGV